MSHLHYMHSLPLVSTRLTISLFHWSQAQLLLTRELGQQLKEGSVEWCHFLTKIRLSLIAEVIKQLPSWPSTHPHCFWPSCSATFLPETYQNFRQVWIVVCWVWQRTWATLPLAISPSWFYMSTYFSALKVEISTWLYRFSKAFSLSVMRQPFRKATQSIVRPLLGKICLLLERREVWV